LSSVDNRATKHVGKQASRYTDNRRQRSGEERRRVFLSTGLRADGRRASTFGVEVPGWYGCLVKQRPRNFAERDRCGRNAQCAPAKPRETQTLQIMLNGTKALVNVVAVVKLAGSLRGQKKLLESPRDYYRQTEKRTAAGPGGEHAAEGEGWQVQRIICWCKGQRRGGRSVVRRWKKAVEEDSLRSSEEGRMREGCRPSSSGDGGWAGCGTEGKHWRHTQVSTDRTREETGAGAMALKAGRTSAVISLGRQMQAWERAFFRSTHSGWGGGGLEGKVVGERDASAQRANQPASER
jgi:hypothetical protein